MRYATKEGGEVGIAKTGYTFTLRTARRNFGKLQLVDFDYEKTTKHVSVP